MKTDTLEKIKISPYSKIKVYWDDQPHNYSKEAKTKVRNYFAKRTVKERYSLVRSHNREMNLQSKNEYEMHAEEHPKYIPNPKEYFKDHWISWYDYLGVDTSQYPQTKYEWVQKCKEMNLNTWEKYKQAIISSLPKNPIEMYEDYNNWDKEFELEEEIVW